MLSTGLSDDGTGSVMDKPCSKPCRARRLMEKTGHLVSRIYFRTNMIYDEKDTLPFDSGDTDNLFNITGSTSVFLLHKPAVHPVDSNISRFSGKTCIIVEI